MTDQPHRRSLNHEEQRAHDIAAQLALTELLRIVIGEIVDHAEPSVVRARLQSIEAAAVGGITGRDIFPGADPVAVSFIKEAAANWITTVLASIQPQAK